VAIDPFLAWLPDAGAAEILEGHPEVIFGTSFTPTGGQAVPVDGIGMKLRIWSRITSRIA
jgi:hypothetical protein